MLHGGLEALPVTCAGGSPGHRMTGHLSLAFAAEKGPWGAVLQEGREAFADGDYDASLLAYLRAGEMGYELGQSNAAWLITHVSWFYNICSWLITYVQCHSSLSRGAPGCVGCCCYLWPWEQLCSLPASPLMVGLHVLVSHTSRLGVLLHYLTTSHLCSAAVQQGYSAAAGGAGSLAVGLHQHAAQQGHMPALLAVGDAFWCVSDTAWGAAIGLAKAQTLAIPQ